VFMPYCSVTRSPKFVHGRGRAMLQVMLTSLFSLALSGCGNAIGSQHGNGSMSAPVIVGQPVSQSVPMGLTALFAVSVTGYPLNYQWAKNGVAIEGATDSTYSTPPTAFTDSGSTFTATISNSLGSVTSNPATLTVTARAPKAGDLRFQQVDAPSTVNGYGNGPVGVSSALVSRGGAYFSSSIGSPLYIGPIVCGQPPVTLGEGCEWPFEQFYLPSNLVALGLSAGYGSDFYANFQTDLYSSTFPAGGNAISSPNSVVTSLDLESPDSLFAASWIQSSQSTGFGMTQQTVTISDFQAAATQEGSQARVITSVSYNAGQVVYLPYSWSNDTSTVYEAQVTTASGTNVASAAAGLAAQGYIITAIGGSNLNDSYLLVGTRVQGDTMPRPFLATTNGETIVQSGYAMVGVVQDNQGNVTYLGQR